MISESKDIEASTAQKDREIKEEDIVQPVSVFQLFKYSTSYERLLLALGMLGGCATGITMPLFSIIFGEVLNEFSQPAPPGDTTFYQRKAKTPALLFTYLMIFTFITASTQMGLFTITAERQTLRIRQKYLAAVLAQDISWFDERQSGELASRVAENTVIIKEAIGDKLGNLFQFMTMFFGGFGVGFYFNWKLTLVMLSMLPAIGAAGYVFTKATADATNKGLGSYVKAGSVVQEALINIRTVTAFHGQQHILHKYDNHLKSAQNEGMKKSLAQGIGMGATMGALFCCYALAFGFGSILISRDRRDTFQRYPLSETSIECQEFYETVNTTYTEQDFCGNADRILLFSQQEEFSCDCGCAHPNASCLPGGDVTLVFFSVLMASFAIGQATPSITALNNGRVAAARIYEVINRKPEINGSGDVGAQKVALKGSVKFENVHFAYPTRKDVEIFKNFNLEIPAGKSTALVGGSGCGKSTVMALIQRFYDPDSGKVLFDNNLDLRDLHLSFIRNQFGLVAQEPVLFATTIIDNIALGAKLGESATDEAVIQAAKAANAYDFIMSFPDKFNTLVGARGAQLSGGQKQRIAIARALLRDPTFLLLDEATSALDNESEKVVQKALDKLLEQKSRTTIVIAHRLSTVRNCDNIVVLGEGRVLEQGTHAELLNLPKGVYSMLVDAASKTQESEEPPSVSDLMAVSRENSSAVPSRGSTIIEKEVTKEKKSETKKETYRIKYSRLLALVKTEKWILITSLIAAAINGAVFPVFSLYLGDIMATLFEFDTSVMRDDSRTYAWIFVGIAGVSLFANFFQAWGFGVIAEKITHRVRFILFDSILKKQISFFDLEENSVGALSSRLSTDAALVKANVADRLSLLVQNLVTVILGFTLAFINGWQLTLMLVAVFPIMSFAAAMEVLVSASAAREDDTYLQPAASVLQESISGIRTVTAFNSKDRIVGIYKDLLKTPMKIGTKKGIAIGFAYGVSQAVLLGLYGLTFYVGALFIDDGLFNFEEMLKVFWLVLFTAWGVGQTFAMAPDVAKGSVAVSNVFSIVDAPTTIDPSVAAGTKSVDYYGATLQKVDFTYPSRPDARILQSMSMVIEPGKTVALVGSSGSGKSTVIALLERFYDPNRGKIVIGKSTELTSLNIGWWRQQIALVEQEPNLFASSISDNIRFGSENISQQEIEEAAKAANAHDFIMSFPQGYNTLVGEQGTQLSGGQKQRICIARAIIRKPSLLLLDEATSALDNHSEKVVQQALDKYVSERNMTTVVIAHRLTTIQNADKIVVFAHGKLLEQGTHAELMALRGGYFKLWEAQGEHSS